MTLRPVAAARRTTARRTRTGCAGSASAARGGAHDRASPNFMGLASLGLDNGMFCDFLYSVLLLSVFLGLYFLGLALSRPQVPTGGRRARTAGDGGGERGGAAAQ
jgi:hypothetical protein